MAWQADDPAAYEGQVIATGHCVRFVQEAAGCPHTSAWRRGRKVKDGGVPAGAAIATFGANGRYQNRADGSSHAAILVAETVNGLEVWDQWVGHPVATRLIRFRGGAGRASNDGDRFYVIEAEASPA